MSQSSFLESYCNHKRLPFKWNTYDMRVSSGDYTTRLACQKPYAEQTYNCYCECHKPFTDGYLIQNGPMPFEWDSQAGHDFAHYIVQERKRREQEIADRILRRMKIEELADVLSNFRNLKCGFHQKMIWGFEALRRKKVIEEITILWHELNEEMRVIYHDRNGEGWEQVYTQMRLLDSIMWENNILRPDPVDGFVMGILNV